jgi:hypothetical protein
MKARQIPKAAGPNHDLKRLRELAYHRFESSEDLVRSFDRFRRVDHPDLDRLQKLSDWLFVPITLWPFNIEGLFRTALDRLSAGKRLENTMGRSGIIPANRNNAACHTPCSRWIRIAGDRETRMARHRNRLDEPRTSDCQCRAHRVASPERFSPAAGFATSVVAPDKGILGTLYLLSFTI